MSGVKRYAADIAPIARERARSEVVLASDYDRDTQALTVANQQLGEDYKNSVVVAVDMARKCERLQGEVSRLRDALKMIMSEVDGNLRPTIRDLVNRDAGVNNGAHPNELYAYCETIEAAASAATSATADGEEV